MKYSDIPAKVPIPFANSGSKNTIPTDSQIGITAGAASLVDGFPPLTFTPVAAGGVPPSGKDFNGIFNLLSQNTRWSNAGACSPYDATFATTIGGYPQGSIVLRSDGGGFWLSTVDDNSTDPEGSGASGWVPIINRVPTVSTGTTAAYSVADSVGAYTTGAVYSFVAHTANTGSTTVDFGAGAVAIKTPAGAALPAGSITANTVAYLRYDGTNFVLQNTYVDSSAYALVNGDSSKVFNVAPATTSTEAVPKSQLDSATALFTTVTDQTANRSNATTYTNSSGKPLFLFISFSDGGGSTSQTIVIDGVNGPSVNDFDQTSGNYGGNLIAIIPIGSTYSSVGQNVIQHWIEIT